MAPFIEKLMQLSPATPASIARKIHKVIESDNPQLRVPVTFDAWLFGVLRKILPRRLYHLVMYYSLPHVFRWGEDDHYHMDAAYELRDLRDEMEMASRPLERPLLLRSPNERVEFVEEAGEQASGEITSS